jgi:hypothetical protein
MKGTVLGLAVAAPWTIFECGFEIDQKYKTILMFTEVRKERIHRFVKYEIMAKETLMNIFKKVENHTHWQELPKSRWAKKI